MVKQYKSLDAFSKQMNRVNKKFTQRENIFLNLIGKFIKVEARKIIGSESVPGYYDEWPELAEATKADKERLGFDFNADYNPLLRTGTMRDSIEYQIQPHQVYIGSPSDILVYQEIGTVHIPPRPVLGLAMYKEKVSMHGAINNFLISWILDVNPKGKVK